MYKISIFKRLIMSIISPKNELNLSIRIYKKFNIKYLLNYI